MGDHNIHDTESPLNSHDQAECYNAVQMNDTVTVLGFIGDDAFPTSNVNYVTETNEMGWTMLHWTAFHGNEQVGLH